MLGPQCCENPPVLNPLSGSGHVEKLGGLDVYVSGSPDSNKCVLLVSDIYGYEAPNLRALADKVAASGFYVVVPDYFYGDPYDPSHQDRPVPVWIKDHGPDKGFEDTKPVLEAIKNKGITAIGAAGMCWGGEFLYVKVPIAILGAENDFLTPPALVKQFEEILASKPEVGSYVKIFPNVSHGWTTRYDINDPEAVKAAEEAHKEMLDWFVTYVQ
ncbi:hypothetical protein DY000_02041719 [Brassica cretica]|uniref:Dienelactone hydrolase domain-containing protein n=1 Tax=Brassica cretica TaxID=69181 RepID=A0ABQ7BFP0_BRACR|nr:hypothetical protein DY000_02041719 [Brassica cretica]